MLESNACTLQNRKAKLLEERQIIQQTLADNLNVGTGQGKGKNKVTEVLKKFLQYRSKCISSHKDTEAHIKVFAFNLYCSQPRLYKQLKSTLGLPDENVFQNFSINLSPKFENSLLYFLSSKLNSLRPEMNHFVLCVDRIKLNRNFAYDTKRDVIVGFHNISGAILNQSASDAYVILLRSVRMNWVQLVAYAFVSENDNYTLQVASWSKKVISLLLKVGIQVYAVITSPNCIAGQSQAVSSHLNSEHYFTFENGKKVYELHDLRYMIEAVRDCLIKNDFFINNSRISWHYIKLLFYQKDLIDSGLEITEAHVHPRNGQSQNSQLKKAFEIFSMNVYNAFDKLINRGILPSEARATADFVQVMSRLCDIVNYNPKSNKKMSIDDQVQVLDSTLEMFIKIGSVEAAIISIKKALSAMWRLLRYLKKRGLRHVYMSRLNKAPLVAFFRSIPRVVKAGKQLRPTASQLLAAFRSQFTAALRRRPHRPRHSALAAAARSGLLDPDRAPASAAPRTSALRLPFPNADYRIQIPKSASAEVYIAAFLLYKCMEVHKCPELDSYLSPRQLLFDIKCNLTRYFKTLNRSCDFYGELLNPPKVLVTYVGKLLEEYPFQLQLAMSSGCMGGRVLRGLSGGRAMLCRCFPWRLLRRLLLRLLLWIAVSFSNDQLRRGHRRGGSFGVPRIRGLHKTRSVPRDRADIATLTDAD